MSAPRAPTLASSACRYATSGPSRTSRSWPPARSTSGPAVLPNRSSPFAARWSATGRVERSANRAANPGPWPLWVKGGCGLLSDTARDVRQSPPQPPIVELVEVEVAVKRGSPIINRVNDHRVGRETPGRPATASLLPGGPATCSGSGAALTSHSTGGSTPIARQPVQSAHRDGTVVAMPTMAFVWRCDRPVLQPVRGTASPKRSPTGGRRRRGSDRRL